MDTLTNGEDPAEMPQIFGLQKNEIQYILEIITYYPSIYTTDHSDATVSNLKGLINFFTVVTGHLLPCAIRTQKWFLKIYN